MIFLILPAFNNPIEIGINNLDISGDLNIRVERDWDSTRPDGTMRDDRDRLRGRFRLQLRDTLGEHDRFGARLRSGDPDSQQSPHVTFGDGSDAFEFGINKLYIEVHNDTWTGWAGKNSLPFWTPNELAWDDDVKPEGLAAIYQKNPFRLGRGYFVVDHSNLYDEFAETADMGAIQPNFRARARLTGWPHSVILLSTITQTPSTRRFSISTRVYGSPRSNCSGAG